MSLPPPLPSDAAGPRARARHPRAVLALVCGILSVTFCGVFAGVPAIIFGRQVIRETAVSGGTLTGAGLGQAGFALGIIGIAVSVVAVAVRLAV